MTPFPNIIKTPTDTITNASSNNTPNVSSEIPKDIITPPRKHAAEPIETYIYDTHPYTVINLETNELEDFHYLHGEQLSKTYDFCSSSPSGSLNVHICMVGLDFQCNYDGDHLPFLRFLMENNTTISPHVKNNLEEVADDISDTSSLGENITQDIDANSAPNMRGGYGYSSPDDTADLNDLLSEEQPPQHPIMETLPVPHDIMIQFPECNINCIADDANNTMDIYFYNECKKRVLDFFAIEGYFTKDSDFGERLNKSYRGYRELGEGEIVVVFDITPFMSIPLRKSKNPVWIVVDDLLTKVLPFSPKVLDFFEQNPYMKEIRDPLNNPVEMPKTVYLYNIETSRYMTQTDKSDWIEPRSLHDTYGFFYYFKLFSGDVSSLNTNRKTILFLKNYADFLDNDTSLILRNSSVDDTQSLDISPPHTPLHRDVRITSSGILSTELIGEHTESSPRNSLIQNDEGKQKTPTKKTDELSLSDNIHPGKNTQGDYDKEPIENNLPFISIIMFTENGEPTYCVKTESIFMEL